MKTAEARFCRDGYEKTSVQDILDDLKTSKGSFYHHFDSKEALLEEICKNRAIITSEKIFSSLIPGMNPEERLNVLISGMIPFNGEKLNFLLMLIPVFSGPEGITVRNCYANVLEAIYAGKVAETLQKGTGEGLFACADAGPESIIILYAPVSSSNLMWMQSPFLIGKKLITIFISSSILFHTILFKQTQGTYLSYMLKLLRSNKSIPIKVSTNNKKLLQILYHTFI